MKTQLIILKIVIQEGILFAYLKERFRIWLDKEIKKGEIRMAQEEIYLAEERLEIERLQQEVHKDV